MQLCANKLDKKDFFGKSDPFLVFYRSNEDGTWVTIHSYGTLLPHCDHEPSRALRQSLGMGHLRLHQDLSPEFTQSSTQYVFKKWENLRNLQEYQALSLGSGLPQRLVLILLLLSRFTICHKTEVVKNTLNPVWQPFSIPVRALCNGDYDRSALA